MTMHHLTLAFYGAATVANQGTAINGCSRAAYDDCMELLDHSVDHLSKALTVVSSNNSNSRDDVMTWLSAALTNQETCNDGLEEAEDPNLNTQMQTHLKDLTELVSNCLSVFAASSKNQDFAGVPIQNKRRKLLERNEENVRNFPHWVKRSDSMLLQTPASIIQADIVVSKDGNGSYKKISEAIKAVPDYNSRRVVIYIKEGQYDENLKIGRKKTNIMFVGDGKGRTVIAGCRSVGDNYTTFHTATVAAIGTGFIMKDLTVENWAGPEKHQAVALRVSADHAVVYRCNIIGYQDTLYVHSQRQFFRECDIYGTVDFIFGNAAVVLQNCSIWARKPLDNQKNTITAQNRNYPDQNTGISIHASRIVAAADLQPVKSNYSTYLGRPWKMYSRTVYMMSYIGDHIKPVGWLEWNDTFALDTLYYAEYNNYGPGSTVDKRVAWPGYRVITAPQEAAKFTVSQFIFGTSWLPSTGVAFLSGLSM
ncbi:putative pectinesterase/pectinesterase inhibitor 34 [Carex rostrata]